MKLERVERLNLGLSAGAIAASYALSTPHFATSVALGACLEAVNFGAMLRGARHFFAGNIQGAGPWVGGFTARFLLLAIGIFAFLRLGADPAALLIGLSIAMPAVLLDAWIHRPEPVDPTQLPALDPDDEAWDRWSVWRVAELAPREDADEASPAYELDQQSNGAKPREAKPAYELDQQSNGAKPRSTKDDR